jgi:mono/diheme cytochrome c family protein
VKTIGAKGWFRVIGAGICLASALAVAVAADPTSTQQEPAGATPFDVKATFRNICSFCHDDYGRHEGKGPQLMYNPNSDDFLVNRIKNGMPGRMAAFGSVFTDAQIRLIVKFIRNLKPGEEPENP